MDKDTSHVTSVQLASHQQLADHLQKMITTWQGTTCCTPNSVHALKHESFMFLTLSFYLRQLK